RQLTSRDGEVENYATIAYGTLEKHTGRVRLALAGHPYPLVLRHGGGSESLTRGGLPVGMFPTVQYTAEELQLAPGDKLVLYSDGVTECRNPDGEAFGDARLHASLSFAAQNGLELTAVLDQRLRGWREPREFEDDISLLVLERPLHFASDQPVAGAPTYSGADPPRITRTTATGFREDSASSPVLTSPPAMRLRLYSDPADVAGVQPSLLDLCLEAGLDDMAAFKLTTAIVEALNNCIEHAYGGEPGHPIDLEWTRNAETVGVVIHDRGRPLPAMVLDPAPLAASDAESGRGWRIIHEWTDAVSYSRYGEDNVLTLSHRLPHT
ncbi:MAG: SpoIIE family protein phosphatase, partial [Chromatiaceae bacterium]|nr:SpoIIE family protein phosphatase [Candidatus Thioaporhodococcus sediminis]